MTLLLGLAPPTSGTSSSPATAATEIVHRPDPGLARGRWEAPFWSFWVALGIIAALAAVYVLVRRGVFSRPKKDEPAPASTRKRP
ncbi:MAG: hypothetical protein JNL38_39890 [Myxococcales bacterium]|nr:hypothetical protein [Myxococcales bacterium]